MPRPGVKGMMRLKTLPLLGAKGVLRRERLSFSGTNIRFLFEPLQFSRSFNYQGFQGFQGQSVLPRPVRAGLSPETGVSSAPLAGLDPNSTTRYGDAPIEFRLGYENAGLRPRRMGLTLV